MSASFHASIFLHLHCVIKKTSILVMYNNMEMSSIGLACGLAGLAGWGPGHVREMVETLSGYILQGKVTSVSR